MFDIESPIFKNRSVFGKKYIPPLIIHREEQIKQVEDRLKWALMGSKPKDHIIYGYGGTGKTLISLYVVEELCKRSTDVTYYYVNLKEANTEVKALNKILEKMSNKTAKTCSSQDLFQRVFQHIETLPQKHIILILDEIDKVQTGLNGLLYCLLRTNEVSNITKELTLIATSNDFNFPRALDIGTKSSVSCMDKLIFPPYNAAQLKDIIAQRAKEGLKEQTYTGAILGLCAAFGAQEHADARKTIELLEKSAEIAMIEKSRIITEQHVTAARSQNEFEGVYSGIKTLPSQCKAVALACVKDYKNQRINSESDTDVGTVYTEYKKICHRRATTPLTRRRVVDILDDLGFLGMINCTLVFNDQHRGRKKKIELLVEPDKIESLITDDDMFKMFKPQMIQKHIGE